MHIYALGVTYLFVIMQCDMMMNEHFLLFWTPEQELDIDESMIPCYAKHSAKQFMKGKPIRFAFKLWWFNSRLSYLIQC